VAAASDAVFKRLARVMGRPELAADEKYATAVARNRYVEPLDALLGEWTSHHTLEELERKLQAADVPASRVYTMADVFRDPHFAARGEITRVADTELGTLAGARVGTPVRCYASWPGFRMPAYGNSPMPG
jgi:formyl-CoA transferase